MLFLFASKNFYTRTHLSKPPGSIFCTHFQRTIVVASGQNNTCMVGFKCYIIVMIMVSWNTIALISTSSMFCVLFYICVNFAYRPCGFPLNNMLAVGLDTLKGRCERMCKCVCGVYSRLMPSVPGTGSRSIMTLTRIKHE